MTEPSTDNLTFGLREVVFQSWRCWKNGRNGVQVDLDLPHVFSEAIESIRAGI